MKAESPRGYVLSLAGAALLLWQGGATRAQGPVPVDGEYQYTLIATDTGGNTFGAAVNNAGQVAFMAGTGTATFQPGVFRGDGQTLTPVALWPAVTADTAVSIADDGTVAFGAVGGPFNNQYVLVKGNGGPLETLVTGGNDFEPDTFRQIRLATIANDGRVAFQAFPPGETTHVGVYSTSGGVVSAIAPPGLVLPEGTASDSILPAVNNTGGTAFFTAIPVVAGIYHHLSGTYTRLGSSPGGAFGLNDAGRSAFSNQTGDIVISDSGVVTTLAFSADGYNFQNESGTAINNDDEVAVVSIGAGAYGGLFVVSLGEAPRRVVPQGAVLPGLLDEFGGARISNEAINDVGQVAFIANQNSRPAIYRADPRGSTPRFPTLAVADGSGQRIGIARKARGALLPLYVQSRGLPGDRYELDAALPDLASLIAPDTADGGPSRVRVEVAGTTYELLAGQRLDLASLVPTGVRAFTVVSADGHAPGALTLGLTFTGGPAFGDVLVRPPASCAVDVTASFSEQRSSSRFNRATGRHIQTITLRHVGTSALAGPVSFAVDALPPSVTLANASGVTSCAAPAGSPFVLVSPGRDGVISPGERTAVVLEFVTPTATPITFTWRVLAGNQR